MGSSSLITNLDGETVQHIEYVPFGEVFIEERNNTWNTPFLFNAKELDEETGLYYYGARYYDPRVSIWLSTDPLQEKYPGISTYAYCALNPVKFVDLGGDEPKWGQLANKHQIRREISYALFNKKAETKSIQNQLTVLVNHFEANRMFTRKPLLNTLTDVDRSKNVKRYVYTEKAGWIDMHHFFKLAEVTMNYGTASAITYSNTSEAYQYLDSNPSGYSYEDLPSNLAGIAFWKKYGDDILANKISIKDATIEFLEKLGAVEPNEAPNYEYIPHIIDNDYVLRNTTPNPLLGNELKEKHREIHQSRPLMMQMKIKEAHESISD